MNRLLILTVAGLAFASGSALAADLAARPAPVYKAPPLAPAPSWTGCYLDAGGGYGFFDQNHQSFDPVTNANLSQTSDTGGQGVLGRVGAGCDYQFGLGNLGNWVIGAFGDYDFAHIHGTFQNTSSGVGGDENESSAWAVGGRLGYLVTPSLLTYVDGGYTEARFDQVNLSNIASAGPATVVATIPATTYQGWFIGGGTEYGLNFSWLPVRGLFWRNEYRYSRYDNTNVQQFLVSGALGVGDRMQTSVQTITSSLVWRWN